MVEIPENKNTSVHKIYEAYEEDARRDENNLAKTRGHLGASLIGAKCDRKLWYSFRWATAPSHTGRMLRLFETGNLEESRITANLRRIGVEVEEVDPETGKQWAVRDDSGHFGGSLDAIGHGFVEAPKTLHVLEYKTHNEKSFKHLCKYKVKESKPQHYMQMQVYMHLMKIDRAFYIAVNKNTDEIYSERVHYDAALAMRLVARAKSIIFNPIPPNRISNDSSWYECKMCNHRGVCFGSEAPARHCRSCLFSEPIVEGQWYCNKHEKVISLQTQRVGCDFHRYVPQLLISATQIDVADDFAWVEYQLPDGTMWRDEGN